MANTKSITCAVILMGQIVVVNFMSVIPIPFMNLLLTMFLMPFLTKKHLFITQVWEGLFLFTRLSQYFPIGILLLPLTLSYAVQGTFLSILLFAIFNKTNIFKKIMRRIGQVK